MRNWTENKSFFPLLFLLVLIGHMGFLLIRMGVFQYAKIKIPEPKEKRIVVNVDPESFKLNKQIVRSEDGGKNIPTKGAFLSDKTRSFDRQTRARVTDSFKGGRPSESAGSGRVSPKNLKFSEPLT
jgi:hypothetical protein